jgi:hypothetical protein
VRQLSAPSDVDQQLIALQGYRGPVALPGTRRYVWWTGRVAIGLRFESAPGTQAAGLEQPLAHESLRALAARP